jgi:hypothetical protein
MKLWNYLIICAILATSVLGDYNASYGKIDTLELSIDMFIDFLIGVAPYAFFIFALLLIYWVVKKLTGE